MIHNIFLEFIFLFKRLNYLIFLNNNFIIGGAISAYTQNMVTPIITG